MKRIAVIPGDGIGKEVVREGLKVLEYFNGKDGLNLSFEEFDFGAECYLRTGELISDADLKKLETFDLIYLGAQGFCCQGRVLERSNTMSQRLHRELPSDRRPDDPPSRCRGGEGQQEGSEMIDHASPRWVGSELRRRRRGAEACVVMIGA